MKARFPLAKASSGGKSCSSCSKTEHSSGAAKEVGEDGNAWSGELSQEGAGTAKAKRGRDWLHGYGCDGHGQTGWWMVSPKTPVLKP